MPKVNLSEAKARLLELLERALRGKTVVFCQGNAPVAELRPLPQMRIKPRPLGLAKGTVIFMESFFDPLPEDLLEALER